MTTAYAAKIVIRRKTKMLESIIAKLCNYLGDYCGMDYDDLKQCCNLNDYEIERVKEIVEDDNKYDDEW
jgi:hypothetical protein